MIKNYTIFCWKSSRCMILFEWMIAENYCALLFFIKRKIAVKNDLFCETIVENQKQGEIKVANKENVGKVVSIFCRTELCWEFYVHNSDCKPLTEATELLVKWKSIEFQVAFENLLLFQYFLVYFSPFKTWAILLKSF